MWRTILSISSGIISSAIVTYSLYYCDKIDNTFKNRDSDMEIYGGNIDKENIDKENIDKENIDKENIIIENNIDIDIMDTDIDNIDNKDILVVAIGSFSVGSFVFAYLSGSI